jgi:lipoprotein-anchoring transpeptidase ErfK/SrfK
MLIESIAPLDRATVGVAMPISIVFSKSVNVSARKDIEQHITLATSAPVQGAWHWFSDRRVDFRPTTFWSPGTTVAMVANFAHVGDGYGRYGTSAYTRTFTIGDDIETHVYVDQHKTVVTKNGQVIRTMLSDAGNPKFPTWDGTMAVVGKAPNVRMTSCSVGITCNPKDPNFYDLTLPWDVEITWSGTYLHYSTGDPNPGHSYGSHGCVHLSWADSQWFYNLSKPGDPVTITGSPRGLAAGDNGYADYNVSWTDWLAGSGMGQFTTAV